MVTLIRGRWRRGFVQLSFPILMVLAAMKPMTAQVTEFSASGGESITVSNSPRTSQPTPSSGPHTLEGMVVDATNGEPIRRAQVLMYGRRQDAMLTDAGGRFVFDELPTGGYVVQANRPGYLNNPRSAVSVGFDSDAKSSKQAVIKLFPQAVIEGNVKDTQGEPMEGVSVSTSRPVASQGRRRWENSGRTQTDENGHYRIAGLNAGAYILRVEPRAEYTHAKGHGSLYFPAVPDRASADRLQLIAGQQLTADFEMPLIPVFRVSGSLGAAVESGYVRVLNADGEPVGAGGLNPETGRFEIRGLPAGSYRIRAEVNSSGDPGEGAVAIVPITVGPSRTDLVLVPNRKSSIPIHTRLESNEPSSIGADQLKYAAGSIQLVESGLMDRTAQAQASGKDTHFALTNLTPGIYHVESNWRAPCPIGDGRSGGSMYLASMHSGPVDLMREPLVVPDGGQADPIELVFKDDGAAISVSLTGTEFENEDSLIVVALPDGGGPPVTGWFMGSRANLVRSQTLLCGLAPGEYSIIAVKNFENLEYMNPDALQPLLANAVHVSLSAKSTTDVRIDTVVSGDR